MFSYLKRISKHTLIYGLGGISEKFLAFLLLPLYTNVLSTEDYGKLALLRITLSVILTIAGLGIVQALYRFYYQQSGRKQEDYVVGTSFLTLVGFSSVILIFLLLFSEVISNIYFSTHKYKDLFDIIFLTFYFDMLNTFSLSILRIHEKSAKYVTISLIGLTLSLVLNIYFVAVLGIGIKGVLLSSLISAIIVFIIFIPHLFSTVRLRYSTSILKELLSFGIPLVPAALGSFIIVYSDMFFLKHFSTLQNVGIYALAYKFGLLVSALVVNPFDITWAPLKYKTLKERNADKIYANVLTYFFFVAAFISLCLSILIKDVLTVISDQSYLPAYKFVGLIAFSYVIYGVYRIVCLGIDIKKKTSLRAIIVVLSSFVNLLLNYSLIPIYHVAGAAVSTLISYLFMAIATFICAQKLFYINYQMVRLMKIFLASVIIYFTGQMIDTKIVLVNFLLKIFLVMTYPIFLYFLRFYLPEELFKIKEISYSMLSKLSLRFANAIKAK